MQISTTTMENITEAPQKSEHRTAYDPAVPLSDIPI
jgi:hypothetical protein